MNLYCLEKSFFGAYIEHSIDFFKSKRKVEKELKRFYSSYRPEEILQYRKDKFLYIHNKNLGSLTVYRIQKMELK